MKLSYYSIILKYQYFRQKMDVWFLIFQRLVHSKQSFFLKGNMAFLWVCHMGVTLRLVA